MRAAVLLVALAALLASANAIHACDGGWTRPFSATSDGKSYTGNDDESNSAGAAGTGDGACKATFAGRACCHASLPRIAWSPPCAHPSFPPTLLPTADEVFDKTIAAGIATEHGCKLLSFRKEAACYNPQYGRTYNHIVGEWGFDAQLSVECAGVAETWAVAAVSDVYRNGRFSLAEFNYQLIEATHA